MRILILARLGPMVASAREQYRQAAACKATFLVNVEELPEPSGATHG